MHQSSTWDHKTVVIRKISASVKFSVKSVNVALLTEQATQLVWQARKEERERVREREKNGDREEKGRRGECEEEMPRTSGRKTERKRRKQEEEDKEDERRGRGRGRKRKVVFVCLLLFLFFCFFG